MARIITFLIFGGFGLMLLYVGITQYWRQRRLLRNAVPIVATIVHSAVAGSRSADTDSRLGRDNSTKSYVPEVRFEYEFGGRRHSSTLLDPNIIARGFASHEAAAAELVPYPVGALVAAQVDPSLPEQAYLRPQAGNGPVVFIVLGVILPPLAWWVGQYV